MGTDVDRQPVKADARGFATVHMEWVYWARHNLAGGFLIQLHAQCKILQTMASTQLAAGNVERAQNLAEAADLLYERWLRIVRDHGNGPRL